LQEEVLRGVFEVPP